MSSRTKAGESSLLLLLDWKRIDDGGDGDELGGTASFALPEAMSAREIIQTLCYQQ